MTVSPVAFAGLCFIVASLAEVPSWLRWCLVVSGLAYMVAGVVGAAK